MPPLPHRDQASGRRSFPTRFLSAEGCYSWQAARQTLRIKVTYKQARRAASPSPHRYASPRPNGATERLWSQAVGIEVPSAQQVLVVGGAVWHCAASLSMPEPALLKALLAATQQQPCRMTLPGPGVLTAGEASLLAVGAEGCGKWIPQEFAASHPPRRGPTISLRRSLSSPPLSAFFS